MNQGNVLIEQLRLLQRQFEEASARWPGLMHTLIKWPENTPEPTDEEIPRHVMSVAKEAVFLGKDDEGTVWWAALPFGQRGDTPNCRYRKGFACWRYVVRNFGRFPHSDKPRDHDDDIACHERFEMLAARVAALIHPPGIGEGAGISADSLVWMRGTVPSVGWLLSLHDVLKPTQRTMGKSACYEVLDDVLLDSARAISHIIPALESTVADGPFGIDGFRYANDEKHGLARKPFALVKYLWNSPDRTADFADLAGPVNGDHEASVDETAVGSWQRDSNNFFRKHGFPFTISHSHQTVVLKNSPLKSTKPGQDSNRRQKRA